MKHIIRKILKEEFNKSNFKNGKSLEPSQWAEDFIKDVWNHPETVEFRRKSICSKDINGCRNCILYKLGAE